MFWSMNACLHLQLLQNPDSGFPTQGVPIPGQAIGGATNVGNCQSNPNPNPNPDGSALKHLLCRFYISILLGDAENDWIFLSPEACGSPLKKTRS